MLEDGGKASVNAVQSLADALGRLDPEGVDRSLQDAIGSGVSPREIIEKGVVRGLEIVGEGYKTGTFFLSDLILSGALATQAIEVVEKKFKMGEDRIRGGRVLIGTVHGDLHDLGKSIVSAFLKAVGYEVSDLGVDVPPAEFVKKLCEARFDVVGMSGLLTVCTPAVEQTVAAITKEGLRRDVKIVLGGRAMSKELAEEVGADAFCTNAWEGINQIKRLTAK